MKTRILQLHNLAIGPRPDPGPLPALLKLFEEKKRVDLLGHIDYLVVCGSFTRDCSPPSFENAREVLRAMARSFLANGGPLANRVFLVPGPGDVPNPHVAEPDFEAFRHFYEKFFREDLSQPDVQFDPNRAELRVLKDLTLIGLSYWRSPDKDVSAGRAGTFKTTLAGIVSSLSQVPLPYLKTTPTLLVSAGTPIFVSNSWLPANADIAEIINPDLRITYHLIADGPSAILPAVPFSVPYFSLAVGAGAASDSLHAHLIEIERDPLEVGERPRMTLSVFRKSKPGATWEEDTRTEFAVPTPFVPLPPEPHVETLYGEFNRTLAGHLKENRYKMIHVQGFPGSGLVEVFTWLTNEPWRQRQIGDLVVGVYCHRWESTSRLAAFLKKLPPKHNGSYHLIVLHDPSLEGEYNEGKRGHVRNIFKACGAWLLEGYTLLYLTGVIGTTLGGLGDSPAGRESSVITDQNSAELPFSALEDFAGSAFLHSYACRMPLQSLQLNTLTGGYIGLSRRFLNLCEREFGGWPGAHGINEGSSSLLLGGSLRHPEVGSACGRFLDAILLQSSHKIFDDLRRQVLDRFSGKREGADEVSTPHDEVSTPQLPDEVEVELKELVQAGTLRDLLLNHKVLGHVGADRYRIRVVAPFLVRSEYQVFFSYHHEDRDYVERIRHALELEADRRYLTLKINTYSLDTRPPKIASHKLEDLLAALRESANLFVFLVDQQVPRPTLIDEIEIWKQAQPNRRFFSVIPKFPVPWEPGCLLDESEPIPINQLDDSQLASSLFPTLKFSNRSWGFDVARPVATATRPAAARK